MTKSLIAIEPDEGKTLYVTWQTSDVCNYRCAYCNEGNWGGRQPNTEADVYEAVLAPLIMRLLDSGYDRVKLFLSGGEPTHWPLLRRTCEWFNMLTEDHCTVAINTNLSRPLQWWERNVGLFDDVVASYHPGWVKHERFMEIARFLQDKVNYLAVRMMMHEDKWDEMQAASREVWDGLDNVWLEHVPILDEMSTNAKPFAYRDQQKMIWLANNGMRHKQHKPKPRNRVGNTVTMEIYDDGSQQPVNSNRIAAERRNFFKGWQCDIGSSINIAINGDITLASCGQSGIIGNINRTINLDDLAISITCDKSHCHCGTDICIPKRSLR